MGFMPGSKEEQEDAVLGSLIARMGGNGLEATLVENPDRLNRDKRTYPDVTCDGLISILGADALWAVDVMSVTGPIALTQVTTMIQQRLIGVAVRNDVTIWFEGDLPDIASVNSVVAAVDAAVGEAPVSGQCVPSPGFAVRWTRALTSGDAGAEGVVGLDQSALLSDQIEAEIARPLAKKAVDQARAAKGAGCSTAVALDQVGHARIMQGTQWLPQHPNTFRVAVESVLGRLGEHDLDAVLLHDQRGSWHVLTGTFPGV
jgi:hypothetical protein